MSCNDSKRHMTCHEMNVRPVPERHVQAEVKEAKEKASKTVKRASGLVRDGWVREVRATSWSSHEGRPVDIPLT